ncbi:MAG: hypothetical protein EAY65_04510 [Alphaproteobacteria bacterium]|nr:MAG: hypothetical protein EAY65_04510 [Alphaproteobacteria bacterium]
MRNVLLFFFVCSLTSCASDLEHIDGLWNQGTGISPLHSDAEKLEDVFFEPDPDHSFWCSYYNQGC